ncbi:hypothetical protein BMS3Abin01_00747 [bacterium BMS3Abin01]|nr:hypothetical protein BMS3Abin01_00747 [bacterium BMS3Abin01]HDZ59593.1 hypothetical protein [Actinomycetota bacterium]
MHGWDWGHSETGFGIAGGIIMMVFWAAVLIAVILFIVWLFRQIQAGGNRSVTGPGNTSETALDILHKRYAKGEIDKAEFEEKRDTLGRG